VCGAVLFAGVWWAMLTFFVVDSFGIREILLLFGCLVVWCCVIAAVVGTMKDRCRNFTNAFYGWPVKMNWTTWW
jgi:hypothetical protein